MQRLAGLLVVIGVALLPWAHDAFVPTGTQGASILPLPHQVPVQLAALPRYEDEPLTTSLVNHSPTLAPLRGGDLALVWYAGSREGGGDVALQFARWHKAPDGQAGHAGWTEPRNLLTREQLQALFGRRMRYLGNPLLHRDAQNRLHLLFVAVSLGGWAGSRLYHMASDDEGMQWTAPRLIIASPFANVSTLVRARAWTRSDGHWVVPAYFESATKYPLLLVFNHEGELLDRQRFGGRTRLLQPALAVHPTQASEHVIEAWMRHSADEPRRAFYSQSLDGGQSWSAAVPTDLPNSDASLAALPSLGGMSWIAANPIPQNRHELSLRAMQGAAYAASIPAIALELREGVEYSYPILEMGDDGTTHLLYTAEARRYLRHFYWPARAQDPKPASPLPEAAIAPTSTPQP